mgnify:CR=1 FL=1
MSESTEQFYELASRAARSTVAVIDAVAQRGGFKGEEMTSLGGLRDQCIQLIQLAESFKQDKAEESE